LGQPAGFYIRKASEAFVNYLKNLAGLLFLKRDATFLLAKWFIPLVIWKDQLTKSRVAIALVCLPFPGDISPLSRVSIYLPLYIY